MGEPNTNGISAGTTVKLTLDQAVRLVVVSVVFLIGWLWRAQEKLQDDTKAIWTRLEANAEARQALATKIEVMDKLGGERLGNLHGDLDRVERELRDVLAEVRTAKRGGS